jgi:NhaP-type Na+/H+ or K+/H+ antiporter
MADAPIVIQAQAPSYGGQILIGALAGVLAWWLIETLTSARAGEDEDEAA